MSRWWLMALSAMLVGCDVIEGDVDTDPPEPWVWADLNIQVDGGTLVFDPKLQGNPSLSFTFTTDVELPEAGCVASVYAAETSGREWLLLENEPFTNDGLNLTWSGRDDNGVYADPGPVQFSMDLDCGDRTKGFGELQVYVVRLGVVAVDFIGDDNVSLAYHKRELYLTGITELDGIPEYLNDRLSPDEPSDLDNAIGQPRENVAHWENPHIPPWRSGEPGEVGLGQHNFPAGYVAATPASMQVTMGQTATSARTGQTVTANGPEAWISGRPPIRVLADGYEAVDEGIWSPGATLQFDATSALPGTLGRHVESITWTYQAQIDGQWIDIPGSHTTTHPMYLLMGQSQVPDGRADDASPTVSWIGVLEDLSDAVTGLPSNDLDVVMDRLRETLHNDPWFVYNPGDGAYSDFDGPYIYWDEIWVEMTDWLDRTDGIDLYCHSVACVLSSQANHLGIEAHYLTLGVNFRTHLTRAAGSSEWRRWSFNSHGITEVEGRVWDAAVDIDGDANPNSQPVDPVKPMGLPVDEYFDLLTADDVDTVNFGRCLVY